LQKRPCVYNGAAQSNEKFLNEDYFNLAAKNKFALNVKISIKQNADQASDILPDLQPII